ncbi:flippase-like domain-containing protein [bacterium]|nr:flippase-like domain-containing protein [bacterium]
MKASELKCSRTGATSISVPTAHRASGYSSKQKLLFWVRLAVAALALALLVNYVEPSKLLEAAYQAYEPYLGVAVILFVPNIAVQVAKWHYLLRLANPRHSVTASYQSFMVGYPLAFVTPGRLGEIGRAFFVKGISQVKTLKLFFLDKVTNGIVVICSGLTAISILYADELSFPMRLLLWGLVGLSCLAGAAGVWLRPCARWLGRVIRIHHFDSGHYLAVMSCSVLFYLVYLSQFMLLVFAFQPSSTASVFPAASSVFLVKTLIPISFSDLGIREGAAVFFLGTIGVSQAAAFSAAFLLFVINIGIPTLMGLPTLLGARRSL